MHSPASWNRPVLKLLTAPSPGIPAPAGNIESTVGLASPPGAQSRYGQHVRSAAFPTHVEDQGQEHQTRAFRPQIAACRGIPLPVAGPDSTRIAREDSQGPPGCAPARRQTPRQPRHRLFSTPKGRLCQRMLLAPPRLPRRPTRTADKRGILGAKRTATRERDQRTIDALRVLGWESLVLWECELGDPQLVLDRLSEFLGPSAGSSMALSKSG